MHKTLRTLSNECSWKLDYMKEMMKDLNACASLCFSLLLSLSKMGGKLQFIGRKEFGAVGSCFGSKLAVTTTFRRLKTRVTSKWIELLRSGFG